MAGPTALTLFWWRKAYELKIDVCIFRCTHLLESLVMAERIVEEFALSVAKVKIFGKYAHILVVNMLKAFEQTILSHVRDAESETRIVCQTYKSRWHNTIHIRRKIATISSVRICEIF